MNSSDLRERHKPTNIDPPGPDEQKKLQVRIEVPTPTAARQRLQQQRERILQFQQRWERIKADLPPQLSRKHSTRIGFRYVRRIWMLMLIMLCCATVGMISIGECDVDAARGQSPSLTPAPGVAVPLSNRRGDRNRPLPRIRCKRCRQTSTRAVSPGSLIISLLPPGCNTQRRASRRLPGVRSCRNCRVLPLRVGWRDDRISVSRRICRWFRLQVSDPYCRPNVGGVVGLADLYVDPALGFSLGWAAWVRTSVVLRT